MSAGAKIIAAVEEAIAGKFASVTVDGQRWVPETRWRLIETAPKGQQVYLAGQWNDPQSPSYGDWVQVVAFYGSPLSSRADRSLDGWYCGISNVSGWAVTWSHWRELHAPPEDGGGE